MTDDGKTLIDLDEAHALIPSIRYKYELDELEQQNIRIGIKWAHQSRKFKKDYPTEISLKTLHKKMFEHVWEWAGTYRKTMKNIGSFGGYEVASEMKKLCDDVQYQISSKSMEFDEIAVRFHHRITDVHPFPNGNGRFSREATDFLLLFNRHKLFTWGSRRENQDFVREDYIKALRKADLGDYSYLLSFVRE